MKRDWALLAGWGAGVFAAATAMLLAAAAFDGLRRLAADIALMILMGVILGAGPGLLLLSLFLSVRLKRIREGRPRGATLALGTLVGGVLGPPAVLLVPLFFLGPYVGPLFARPLDPAFLLMLGTGAVGGAATGLTCAWRLTAARKEAA
jgi:hypothetical protein